MGHDQELQTELLLAFGSEPEDLVTATRYAHGVKWLFLRKHLLLGSENNAVE